MQLHCPLAHELVQPWASHGVPSGTALPTQVPLPSHVAFCMHASASHALPTAATVSSHAPVPGLQAASRHDPEGVQLIGAPVHAPPEHTAPRRHLLPGSHATPFGLLAAAHGVPTGAVASQVPTWHSVSSAVQSLGLAEQTPAEQLPALTVQPLPPHAVPLGTLLSTQLPVAVLQLGVVWQSFFTHTTAWPVSATHVPDMHESLGVHALPSALQAAPFAYAYVHFLARHVPCAL